MNAALALLPARHTLVEITGAGHELLGRKAKPSLAAEIVAAFEAFFGRVGAANACE
jgi:hypothetical protein